MAKILLFGAGGVGITYAYLLDRGGADVTAVCRSNYEAAKVQGFEISSKIWGNVKVKPRVVKDAAEAQGPFDFIVICSKAYVGVSPSTSDLVKSAVSQETAIVLCQNGIGIEEEYLRMFPQNTIISGVVYLPVTQVKPGYVIHGDVELQEFGTFPANASPEAKKKVEDFAKIYQAGGGSTKVFDDVQEARWRKIILNAAWNPICALSLCPDADFIRSSDEALGIVKRTMMEVVSVARARGYTTFDESTADRQLSIAIGRLDKEKGGRAPSMLTDVREGRQAFMEVEPIVGNTMRIARELSIDTPTLDTLYVLIKGLSKSSIPLRNE